MNEAKHNDDGANCWCGFIHACGFFSTAVQIGRKPISSRSHLFLNQTASSFFWGGVSECSSRMTGNLHVRFLEGWAPAMAPGHSTAIGLPRLFRWNYAGRRDCPGIPQRRGLPGSAKVDPGPAHAGWGTLLTNDFHGCDPRGSSEFDPISLICKVSDVEGRPAVRLSDNYAKALGPVSEVKRYRRVFGTAGMTNTPLAA
jgi:hypothetical protein